MEIRAALAGNPNCGKTTMFNALTGANQYVGNWPGVTVEKKEGKMKSVASQAEEAVLVDLPGIREKRRESKNKRIKRGEDQSDGSSGSLFSFPVYA